MYDFDKSFVKGAAMITTIVVIGLFVFILLIDRFVIQPEEIREHKRELEVIQHLGGYHD